MNSHQLKRSGLRAAITVLAVGVFALALGAKLSRYLPQANLGHYLSNLAKVNGDRDDKIVTALAADFIKTISLEEAPVAPSLPPFDGKIPKSTHVLLPYQFRSPPICLA
jgi:hypothetical protein